MEILPQEYMCMQCGMCTGVCPESGITPFNIRKMVRKRFLRSQIDADLVWLCTSCKECTLRCPRDVRPSEVILKIREEMIEQGRIPKTIQNALENAYVQKNPWGRPKAKRDQWTEDMGIDIPHIKDTSEKRLLFVCCIQAYDPRCMVIPQNVVKIFDRLGIEIGILGKEEVCCGNEIKRMGEGGLFEDLRDENISLFKKYGVKQIITLSPHCMNTFKNEYGDMGIEIFHYTEFLTKIINEKGVEFKLGKQSRIIYHDPCFLGKQNKIFDEPRDILKAIEGVELLEFSKSKEISLCCEGGGGRMFYEPEISYTRNAKRRVDEAQLKGAQIIVTACPFCLMNLEDPAGELDIPVKELSELLVDAI